MVHIEVPKLDLRSGELVAILGQNGTGKSTVLDVLALILSADRVERFRLHVPSGMLDLSCLPRARQTGIRRLHISYVLQSGGLLEFLTVQENIRLAAKLAGVSKVGLHYVSEKLGITDILRSYPGQISGGQRQKAAIARALVQNRDIVLADEPTSALDSGMGRALVEHLRCLAHETGAAVILVTHDHELVCDKADRFYRFRQADERGTLRFVLVSDEQPAKSVEP